MRRLSFVPWTSWRIYGGLPMIASYSTGSTVEPENRRGLISKKSATSTVAPVRRATCAADRDRSTPKIEWPRLPGSMPAASCVFRFRAPSSNRPSPQLGQIPDPVANGSQRPPAIAPPHGAYSAGRTGASRLSKLPSRPMPKDTELDSCADRPLQSFWPSFPPARGLSVQQTNRMTKDRILEHLAGIPFVPPSKLKNAHAQTLAGTLIRADSSSAPSPATLTRFPA